MLSKWHCFNFIRNIRKSVLFRTIGYTLGLHCKQFFYFFLTSSLRTPKFFIKEFSDFLMPCHQHGLGVNLLVQR